MHCHSFVVKLHVYWLSVENRNIMSSNTRVIIWIVWQTLLSYVGFTVFSDTTDDVRCFTGQIQLALSEHKNTSIVYVNKKLSCRRETV